MSERHYAEDSDGVFFRLLCGRLTTTTELFRGEQILRVFGGIPIDHEIDRRVYLDLDFVTVSDFVDGADGATCRTCLRVMPSALDRYWGEDE